MQHKLLSCLLVFLLFMIGHVQCDNKVYCSPDRHMFYIAAGDICKKCDKCNPGWGLEPKENAKFEMSTNGALGCRNCKICDDGYFNRWRSYDSCKRCKDCEAKGRSIKRICTNTHNTKCGKKLTVATEPTKTIRAMSVTSYHNVSMITPATSNESSVMNNIFAHNKIVFGLLGLSIGLFCLFIGILSCLYYVNCRRNRSQGTEQVGNNNEKTINGNDVEADGGIEMESYPCLGNVSTCTNTDSVFQVKDEELTAKQLMFIAKRIAPRKSYREVALELDVAEHEISTIEEDNPRCCKNASFMVLKRWTEIFPHKAFVTKLLTTLGRVGRHDVLRDFCKEFNDIMID